MSYYDSYMIKVIAVWLSCLLLQQIQYSHGHRHNVPQCHNHRSVTPGVLPAFMFSCRRLLGGGVKNRRNSRKIAARRLNDRQSDSMRQIRSIRAATTTTLLFLRVSTDWFMPDEHAFVEERTSYSYSQCFEESRGSRYILNLLCLPLKVGGGLSKAAISPSVCLSVCTSHAAHSSITVYFRTMAEQ